MEEEEEAMAHETTRVEEEATLCYTMRTDPRVLVSSKMEVQGYSDQSTFIDFPTATTKISCGSCSYP